MQQSPTLIPLYAAPIAGDFTQTLGQWPPEQIEVAIALKTWPRSTRPGETPPLVRWRTWKSKRGQNTRAATVRGYQITGSKAAASTARSLMGPGSPQLGPTPRSSITKGTSPELEAGWCWHRSPVAGNCSPLAAAVLGPRNEGWRAGPRSSIPPPAPAPWNKTYLSPMCLHKLIVKHNPNLGLKSFLPAEAILNWDTRCRHGLAQYGLRLLGLSAVSQFCDKNWIASECTKLSLSFCHMHALRSHIKKNDYKLFTTNFYLHLLIIFLTLPYLGLKRAQCSWL